MIVSGFIAIWEERFGRETILPGAFARSLARRSNIPLLLDHAGKPIANTRDGTLELSEDSAGLAFRLTTARRLPRLTGASFAGLLTHDDRGQVIAVDLEEVSLLSETDPAYSRTADFLEIE
jgi:phage head maturation protease